MLQFERNVRSPGTSAEEKLIHLKSPHLNNEQSKIRITSEVFEEIENFFSVFFKELVTAKLWENMETIL